MKRDVVFAVIFYVFQAWFFTLVGWHARTDPWYILTLLSVNSLILSGHLLFLLLRIGRRREFRARERELLDLHNRIMWKKGLHKLIFTNVSDFRDYINKQLDSK